MHGALFSLIYMQADIILIAGTVRSHMSYVDVRVDMPCQVMHTTKHFSTFSLYCLIVNYSTISYTKIVKYKTCKMFRICKGKGKGKAIPLQAWTGPEVSRRLRLPDLKTFGI
jgi:hypothetical protein